MADTPALGAGGSDPVRVQVPPAAPSLYSQRLRSYFQISYKENPMDNSPSPPNHTLRVFVLFSGNASAIRYLHKVHPEYNFSYTIVGAFTNNASAPGISFFTKHRAVVDGQQTSEETSEKDGTIPCVVVDWKTFQPTNIASKREEYFRQVIEAIKAANNFSFDLIVCSGFHLILPDFFIEACPCRIINEHPADLSILDNQGQRLYTGKGIDAVARTIHDNHPTIRSTVHIVSPGPVDTGPIICFSKPLTIGTSTDPATVAERIKLACSGQALGEALNILTKNGGTIPS